MHLIETTSVRKMPRSERRARRHGNVLLAFAILIPALFAVVSLAVDYGRVQLAKSELQDAADAAAKYAAAGIPAGNAVNFAKTAAGANFALGSAVSLTDADIVTGNFDSTNSPKFSSARTPLNAVQVTARRTASRGTGIPLIFASLIGFSSCDVTATSVAKIDTGIKGGVIGFDGITVKNNLLVATYNSSSYTNPSQAKYDGEGTLGSNGAITAKNNEVIGSVILGPSGSHNLSVPGGATTLAADIPAPTIDHSAAPAINPGGISKNPSISGTVTLPGGTYSFTSISIANNGKLEFSGAATVYIDGSVTFAQNGEITAYNSIPSNLKIYQKGSGSQFGTSSANSVDITADVEAPETALAAKNSLTFRGRAVFKTIDAKNNADFFYDGSLNSTISDNGGSGSIATVQ